MFEIMRNFAFMTLSFDSFDWFEPGATDRTGCDTHPQHNADPDIPECLVMGNTDLGHVVYSHLITLL